MYHLTTEGPMHQYRSTIGKWWIRTNEGIIRGFNQWENAQECITELPPRMEAVILPGLECCEDTPGILHAQGTDENWELVALLKDGYALIASGWLPIPFYFPFYSAHKIFISELLGGWTAGFYRPPVEIWMLVGPHMREQNVTVHLVTTTDIAEEALGYIRALGIDQGLE
jgi:hypothetical protein